MKRVILPASALVLVVTGCGAGATPAPRLSEAAARPSSVHALVARRERAALREARSIEREFTPPPGAHSTREPRGYGGVLRRYGSVIRVEARVAWLYPRSPRETVPAATREIEVRGPNVSRLVTNPAKVAKIIGWFDALPVSPPGIALACALVLRPNISLSFRSAAGTELARAGVPEPSAGVCDPIGFTIGAKTERPLIDRAFGESVARRLQRLLRR